MSDGELEQLREQLYVIAETACEIGEGRVGRRMKQNSTLDTDDRRAYDGGGRE